MASSGRYSIASPLLGAGLEVALNPESPRDLREQGVLISAQSRTDSLKLEKLVGPSLVAPRRAGGAGWRRPIETVFSTCSARVSIVFRACLFGEGGVEKWMEISVG
jgi:hypothetical protein